MEPVRIKLKRKYTAEKRVKNNKSSGGNSGKGRQKNAKLKHKPKPMVMVVNGKTGHKVMREL